MLINPYECQLCNKEFKYIAHHLKNKHKVINLADYYKKYILQTDVAPACKKCGKNTLFQTVTKGFYKSCSPSCDNPKEFKASAWIDPVKRRKRSIVSRRSGKKAQRKRWANPDTALKMLKRSFPVWGNRRSKVPRVHSITDFGEFLLRSKIERNFVVALLRSKQHVIKIEYEKTYIRYYSSSQFKYRFYIPDFKIFWTNGLIDLVEIKPEKDKVDPIVVDKQKEAIKYCQSNDMKYYMLSPKEYQKFIECRIAGKSYKNV